jgi:hypothetical protein
MFDCKPVTRCIHAQDRGRGTRRQFDLDFYRARPLIRRIAMVHTGR